MSTRCQIDFIVKYKDKKGKLHIQKRRVYMLNDGYPESVIPDLKADYRRVAEQSASDPKAPRLACLSRILIAATSCRINRKFATSSKRRTTVRPIILKLT